MTTALSDFDTVEETVAQHFGDDPYCDVIQEIYRHWLRTIHPEHAGTDEMIGTLTDDLVWSYTFPTGDELRVTIESGPERGLPPRLTVTVLNEFEVERFDDEDVPDYSHSPETVVALSSEGYVFDETIPPWWFSLNDILNIQWEAMHDADPDWQLPQEGPEYERWADIQDAIGAVFESFCRHILDALCKNSQKYLLETQGSHSR